MTKEQIISQLPNDGLNVFLDLFSCIIPIDSFLNRFNGSTLEYNSLITNSNTTNGWKEQFDSWKERGIIQ